VSDEQAATTLRTPWHFWLVGVLALLWNAMGAFDYLMTETRNEGYMSRFTPEQLEYFYGFPAWVVAFWAIAVWGGVLGAIFLLLKKRHAVGTFLVSFLAMVVTMGRNYLLSEGLEAAGGSGLVFTVAIFVVALFLYLYSRAMRSKGVLT
jgi:hypothetical protein